MRVQNIIEAEVEAERFLYKLQQLKKSQTNGEIFKVDVKRDFTETSKESASLRRSSLDLTRSLAKMRQG